MSENRKSSHTTIRLTAREKAANINKHFAAIESDSGASHPLGFYYTGKPELQPYFPPISNVLRAQGAGLVQIQPGRRRRGHRTADAAGRSVVRPVV